MKNSDNQACNAVGIGSITQSGEAITLQPLLSVEAYEDGLTIRRRNGDASQSMYIDMNDFFAIVRSVKIQRAKIIKERASQLMTRARQLEAELKQNNKL